MSSEKYVVERQVIESLLASYRRNSAEVAAAIDTSIDRSGNLLGLIRELVQLEDTP
jgi:hypothetical protein